MKWACPRDNSELNSVGFGVANFDNDPGIPASAAKRDNRTPTRKWLFARRRSRKRCVDHVGGNQRRDIGKTPNLGLAAAVARQAATARNRARADR
jgi:hypothetical protein